MKSNIKDALILLKKKQAVPEKEPYDLDKVIWSGQPDNKHIRTKYDFLFIPLSWFLLIIAIFWRVALKDAPLILMLLSYVLMIFAFYCLFFRNHFKKKKRERFSYEMTDNDIIIAYTKKKDVAIRQLALENIYYVTYSMRKDGSGTIYFNFPRSYKEVLKLVFANSGLGRFDESINAFFELDDLEGYLKLLKTKLPEKVVYDEI